MKKSLKLIFLLLTLIPSSLILAQLKLENTYPGLEKMSFKGIEADTRMKVALFVDGSEKSLTALKSAQEIKKSTASLRKNNKYNYVWTWVDCRESACAPAFTANFPYIFTHTPVGGIERFPSELNLANFTSFENFRTTEVTKNKVIRYKDEAQIKKLLSEKPILFKMYEQWCGHSRKMEKAFKVASNKVDNVHLVEVECSKANGFCGKFGVNSYPTLKFVNKGGEKMHSYGGSRKHLALIGLLKDEDSWKSKFTEDVPSTLR